MTKLLAQAVATARTLPAGMQDEIARIVLMLAGEDTPMTPLSSEEAASFAESREQARRREFATDDQVRAVWSKHGL